MIYKSVGSVEMISQPPCKSTNSRVHSTVQTKLSGNKCKNRTECNTALTCQRSPKAVPQSYIENVDNANRNEQSTPQKSAEKEFQNTSGHLLTISSSMPISHESRRFHRHVHIMTITLVWIRTTNLHKE